jgi:hypothetical protein
MVYQQEIPTETVPEARNNGCSQQEKKTLQQTMSPELVKDFTHLNFIFMTVRLHVLVRLASELGQGINPKARAMGYSHSYLDPEAACLKFLAAFPSDCEIEIASGQA